MLEPSPDHHLLSIISLQDRCQYAAASIEFAQAVIIAYLLFH
jgi:hypothetical protein